MPFWRLIVLAVFLASSGCSSLRAPSELRAIGFEWVKIEGGPFDMGDTFEGLNEDATPVHEVRVKRFYISRYETTLDQYDWFADQTGRETVLPAEASRGMRAAGNMAWDDAVAFCEFIGGRLPSEQEWEFAASGGAAKQLYPGTDNEDEIDDFIRHHENSLAESFPVGRKKPNFFGLYDMGGNVAEWIGDYYEKYPKPGGPVVWMDLANRNMRLARGGGYSADFMVTRTYWRAGTLKYVETPTIGVRCARDG